MLDSDETRLVRVWSAVHTARRIADARDPLGVEARRRLPETSGLSVPGVTLALERYLETDPEPKMVRQLVETSGRASRCHVLLAANVCTAALRAVACAIATAPWVVVRPSSRDPVLAELLIRGLQRCHDFAAAGGHIDRSTQLEPSPSDEVHLYGSDDTLAGLRQRWPGGVRVREHGSGLALAVVEAGAVMDEATAALAEDLVAFDGKGCLSPRVVLVEGTTGAAMACATSLHQALERRGWTVPRGELSHQEQAELARFRAIFDALGQRWTGPHHDLFLDPDPQLLTLPPAQRCAVILPCAGVRLAPLLGPLRRFVTAIGWSGPPEPPGALRALVQALLPQARQARLGELHRPPLDGPVDLRLRAQ